MDPYPHVINGQRENYYNSQKNRENYGCHDSGRKKGRFLCDFKMMYNVRFFGYYNLILSPIFDYIL